MMKAFLFLAFAAVAVAFTNDKTLEALEGIDHVLEKELDVLEAGVSGLRGTPAARFAGLGTMAGAEEPVDAEDIKIIKAHQEKAGATLEVDGPDDAGIMKKAAATYYPVEEKHCGPRGLIQQPSKKKKEKAGAKFTIVKGTGNSKSKNFGCMEFLAAEDNDAGDGKKCGDLKTVQDYGKWWEKCGEPLAKAASAGPAGPGELNDKFFDLFNSQFKADQSYETEVAKKMTSADGIKGLCPLEDWSNNAGPEPVDYTEGSAPSGTKVIRFENRNNLMEFYTRTGVLEKDAQHWPECSCEGAADLAANTCPGGCKDDQAFKVALVDACKPYPNAAKNIAAYCDKNKDELKLKSAVSAEGRKADLLLQVDPLEDKTGMSLSPEGMVKKADSKQLGPCPTKTGASPCACQQKNFVSSLGSYLQTRTTGLGKNELKVGNVFGAECVRSTMNMWAECCAENPDEQAKGGLKTEQKGDLGTGGLWLVDSKAKRGDDMGKKKDDPKPLKEKQVVKPYTVGTGTCSLALTVAKAQEKGSCMAYDNTKCGKWDSFDVKYMKMLKRDQVNSHLYIGEDGGPTHTQSGFFEETNKILKEAKVDGKELKDADSFMHNNKQGIAWGAHSDKTISPYGNIMPAMKGGKVYEEIAKATSAWLRNLVGGLGRCCDLNKDAAGCKKEDYLFAGTEEVTPGVEAADVKCYV